MDENEIKTEASPPQIDYAALIEQAVEKALKAQAPTEKGAPVTIKSRGDLSPTERFLKYCRTGQKAAMQEGTAEEGGYLVPDDFYANIVAKRDEMSVARAAGCTVVQTSRDVLKVPYENTSHTNFSITSEEAAISQGEPTVGETSITVYKFTKLVKVSEELLEDNATNLEAFLSDAFGRAWALTENAYTIAGTGSGQPQGVLYGGTAGKTFADTNSITAAELIELQHVLPSAYAPGAVWIMRNATLGHIRGLTGNPFSFQATPAGVSRAGAAGDIQGYPVFLSDSMGVYSTTANKSVVFGNMAYLFLAERRGMSVRRLNELYAGNGQVGFLATVRFGCAVVQAEAIQYGTQT